MARDVRDVEPWLGGGQVCFGRDPADPRYFWNGETSDGSAVNGVSEVINDSNGNLMNMYSVLKNPVQYPRLQHLLSLTLCSEAEWYAARDLRASGLGDPVERAAATFTLYRQSFLGQGKTFAPHGPHPAAARHERHDQRVAGCDRRVGGRP